MSIATTPPAGPTMRAAVTAGSPRPVATSNTCWPGRISASSIMRSLIGCSPGPITYPQSFQPAAAALHSFCCPALYLVGSNCCVLIVCLLLPILSLNVHPGQAVLALCIVLISIHCGDGMGLHFLATNCQSKILSRLPWHRDQAELFQHAQAISVAFDPRCILPGSLDASSPGQGSVLSVDHLS